VKVASAADFQPEFSGQRGQLQPKIFGVVRVIRLDPVQPLPLKFPKEFDQPASIPRFPEQNRMGQVDGSPGLMDGGNRLAGGDEFTGMTESVFLGEDRPSNTGEGGRVPGKLRRKRGVVDEGQKLMEGGMMRIETIPQKMDFFAGNRSGG
jgi:hypothetical protein